MNIKALFSITILLLISNLALTQDKPFHVNASLFMLANFTDDSPKYVHVEFARNLNDQHTVGVEFLTWEYQAPLGIPFGEHFDDPSEDFPGAIKGIGVGITYQYFYTKNGFSKIHVTPFYQQYLDEETDVIQTGFQLFTVARTGYRWTVFNDQFFIEPSIAITSWPIQTNMPESFQSVEDKWPSYFLFEPGLNIGMVF